MSRLALVPDETPSARLDASGGDIFCQKKIYHPSSCPKYLSGVRG